MKAKLDVGMVKESFKGMRKERKIETLQVVAYVAAGGGMIGRLYAEQPADAYRDVRAGRAPYSARDLENIRLTLCAMAEVSGLDSHHLPPMPNFHNCGVF
jgi:carbon monoxide dehydrogenase subunit G